MYGQTSTTAHAALFLLASACALVGAHESASAAADPLPSPPDRVSGRVLLPNGKPAEGAVVLAVMFKDVLARTRTDAQGHFELRLDPASILAKTGPLDWKRGSIVAGLTGNGPAWRNLKEIRAEQPIQLDLVEDVPIRGGILDQQGRPVVDAQIRVFSVHGIDSNLDGFLKTNRDRPAELWLYERDHMRYLSPQILPLFAGNDKTSDLAVRTNKEGQFELHGMGKERSVWLEVSGPQIMNETIYVITRAAIDARWRRGALSKETRMYVDGGAVLPTVYPASFRHLAKPGMVVAGTVRDARTNAPVVGMAVSGSVRGSSGRAWIKTDAGGRYVLSGLPLEGRLSVQVLNTGDQPYIDAHRQFDVRPDQQPQNVDFRLTRGVLISGRATETASGKPVRGWVGYLAWGNNPELKKLSDKFDSNNTMMTGEDGRYVLVVPAGPGVLTFAARDLVYEPARSEDFGLPVNKVGTSEWFESANQGLVDAGQFHALKKIEPSAAEDRLHVDFMLSAGTPITCRLVNPHGQPVSNVEAYGATRRGSLSRIEEPSLVIRGLRHGERRTVLFRDSKRQLAAVVTIEAAKSEKPEPVIVRLEPAGIVSGRLVDANGRPLSQWYVGAFSHGAQLSLKRNERPDGFLDFGNSMTDADGYFRITGIPSGRAFEVLAVKNGPGRRNQPALAHSATLRPGQQLDVGAVKIESLP